MKRALYLDDVRTPLDIDIWEVVRSYEELVAVIKKNGLIQYDFVSLDHDLGESAMLEYYNNVKDNFELDYDNIKEKTGYDAAKFLVNESMETGVRMPIVYVHSANPIGSANIMGYVNNYYKNCGREQACVRVQIPHKIEEQFLMTPEERIARWKKSK